MIDEAVLRRIKKCLALSESPEPAEAAAALRQAQKLMAMHGVDQATLRRADLGEASLKSKASTSHPKDWEVALIQTCAGAFGCRVLWVSGLGKALGDMFGQFVIIGLKDQVKLATYTAEVLQRKLMKARQAYLAVQYAPSRKELTRLGDGFCQGWVLGVARTVKDFAQPPEVRQLIDEVVENQTGGREQETQKRDGHRAGLLEGYEAGQGESLYRPVEQSADPVKQLAVTS